MPNLSPTAYSDLAQEIKDNEEVAVKFINKSAFNNPKNKRDSCDKVCRKKLHCGLNYAVNEQSVLCTGYDLPIWQASRYFLGAFQNPWY